MSPHAAIPPASPPVVRSRLWPTREGFGWLAIGVVLLLQGYLRGVNLVGLIACLMLALWLLNVLWVALLFRVKRLRARRRIAGPVFAGEPFAVTLELTNPSGRKQPPVRVIDRGSHHQHAWLAQGMHAGAVSQSAYRALLPRRGTYAWPELTITTGYPFGLLRRSVYIDSADRTLVLPQLGRLHRAQLQRLLLEQHQPSSSQRKPIRRHAAAQTEFYGLREFRTGDSPRWIHWRTSARVGELMVREFVEPPLENLTVLLEPWLPDTLEQLFLVGQRSSTSASGNGQVSIQRALALLERAISLAATLCWEWCKTPGSRVALGIADKKPDALVVDAGTRHGIALLERLALVEGTPKPAAGELVGRLRNAGMPHGPAVLVTTRSVTHQALFASELNRPILVLNVADELVEQVYSERQSEQWVQASRER